VVGDETVFDVSRAIDKIREYGDRRVREAWRRRHRCKVVPLRVVRGLRAPLAVTDPCPLSKVELHEV
jgi:hypothetical protein